MSIQDSIGNCYICHQPGHWAAQCPNGRPAGTLQPYAKAINDIDHMQRIRGYVDEWFAGHIDMQRKRELIAAENLQWYGRPYSRNGILLTTPGG